MPKHLSKLPTSGRILPKAVASALLAALAATVSGTALAEDHVTLLTNWYAQAEHGGYYQALATGIYKKYGLDVTIKMGGPQVNNMQLLAAHQADFALSYDFQILSSVEAGIPATAIAATFQRDPQGIMTHDDVNSLSGLKGKTLLVAGNNMTSWWPWLKQKFGYSDAQVRPYTFSLQPFFLNPNVATQGYASSEPFQAEQAHVKTHFFLFADQGYPPYSGTVVTLQNTIKAKPDVTARFIKASMEGWKSYFSNPAPANVLIKKDNPDMTDAQLAFGLAQMQKLKLVTGGDATTQGIGSMNDTRWNNTYNYMVNNKLLKPSTNLHSAYTLQFVKNTKVLP